MAKKDPRVDAYIANAQPFAQPVLRHIRKQFHSHCPQVEETLKWSMPAFMYKGILGGMAAFKQHAALNFWKHKLVVGQERPSDAMGSFGRITCLADLPSDKNMAILIKKAMRLNDEGVKVTRKPASKVKAPLRPPASFLSALKKNKRAAAAYEAFSYSHRKEYLEWITEAKTEETRNRRLAQALEWMAEGKSRNWKHANC